MHTAFLRSTRKNLKSPRGAFWNIYGIRRHPAKLKGRYNLERLIFFNSVKCIETPSNYSFRINQNNKIAVEVSAI